MNKSRSRFHFIKTRRGGRKGLLPVSPAQTQIRTNSPTQHKTPSLNTRLARPKNF